MNFLDFIVIGLIVWILWMFLSTLSSRGKALRSLAEEKGWKLKSPREVSGKVGEDRIRVTLKEAFLSRVFGGSTRIVYTFGSPLPVPFTVTVLKLIPGITETPPEEAFRLPEGFETGRLGFASPRPDEATAFVADEALLEELRGFAIVAGPGAFITEAAITVVLDGHGYSAGDLHAWVHNLAELATTLAHHAAGAPSTGEPSQDVKI